MVTVQVAHQHHIQVTYPDAAFLELLIDGLPLRQYGFVDWILMQQILDLSPPGAIDGMPAGVEEYQAMVSADQVAGNRRFDQMSLRTQCVGPCHRAIGRPVERQRLVHDHRSGMQNLDRNAHCLTLTYHYSDGNVPRLEILPPIK